MKRLCSGVFLILSFLATASANSGQRPARGFDSFQLEVDVARFFSSDSESYIELYYGIHQRMLAYTRDSGRFVAGANMRLEIMRDSTVVSRREWAVPHVARDSADLLGNQTLTGIQAFALPRGNYILIVSAYDATVPSRRDSVALPLSVDGYAPGREGFSDIELATTIRQSENKQSIFYKNTLEVIPNTGRLYGAGLPILYYYLEVYNLISSAGKGGLSLTTLLVNSSGREVLRQQKAKPRQFNSTVEVGTLNLSTIKGGSYRLRVVLSDTTQSPPEIVASIEKKFFVYRPDMARDSSLAGRPEGEPVNEFAFMSQQELDTHFGRAVYISSEAERQQYKDLTDIHAKSRFLAEFWRRRDTEPGTIRNETKEEYYQRVDYANTNFSIRFREGWRTDRGRVYILYGPSDEIERMPSSSETLPYEIWHYNSIQGGVIFVFVDKAGVSDYLLVHSTHRNELHNENWLQDDATGAR